jgi:hypothetical protein
MGKIQAEEIRNKTFPDMRTFLEYTKHYQIQHVFTIDEFMDKFNDEDIADPLYWLSYVHFF